MNPTESNFDVDPFNLHVECRNEIERLRTFSRNQADEIESIIGYADATESLRDIGKIIGCGHVDSPDERRQLVNCVEQEFQRLESFKQAYEIWQEKTDWVQEQIDGFPFFALGMHRADVMRKEIERLRTVVATIRQKLESIVCTVAPDEGVVLLSQDGPTHTEVIRGRAIEVYDHEYFSPLGDALIELWKLTK